MKKLFLLVSVALAFSACEKDPDMSDLRTDMVVYTDHDNNTDFGKIQTYFLPDSILEVGGHRATYWKDENSQAILDAVEAQMNSRGYTRITDPDKKDEADAGVQLSYITETNQVITGGYFGGWWDYGFWGPWWGSWYYPYPVAYSYDTNTLVMEMVDLSRENTTQANRKLPVVWYVNASGYEYGNSRYTLQLLIDAVNQAFEQSTYVQSVK